MALPAHVCQVLSCDNSLDREQFVTHLEFLSAGALPWFLQDNAARDALVVAIFDGADLIELNAHELSEAVQSVHYLEVGSVQGDLRFLLKVPESGLTNAPLPTAALAALARAWPKVPDLLDEEDVSQLAQKYRNKLIVFSVGDAKRWEKENFVQLVASLLGCRLKVPGNVPENVPGDPHWTSFGRILIDPDGIVAQPALMAGRLLQEVLSEKRIRWRYIALYRVFEAAYLIGLQESLLAGFLEGPKEALRKTQSALESELSTFKELVDDKNLTTSFESFRSIVDADSSNRFLHAIKRNLRHSKSAGHVKGVEYAYKIRCAIVHAGQLDVVFDRYPDGEAGVRLVLQVMEEAILGLFGLRSV